ncbi:ATP-grasp domain-containing protein [Jiella sp. CQZ9-1]|uniref:D-alanine--D-alanine ligase A n=1 Tax=Jiella flava TaxID=2816857 RepID=A0A939FYV0_9HYPH|nr:ATP-grasp domain-containing protein [Jiella flava]
MTSNSKRLRIAVLFGGQSAEHEVSIRSATNVLTALDRARYEPVPVFVTRADGRWLLAAIRDGVPETPTAGTQLCLVPGGGGAVVGIDGDGAVGALAPFDAVFPVLHGFPGEDGAVQGLCDVARVPLVGCGILGSATALDKDVAKRLLRQAGLAVAPSVTVFAGEAPSFHALEDALGMPVFIKPARQGSSVGVSKVRASQELARALEDGFRYDRKLLAEAFINGREIECAVLEDADGSLYHRALIKTREPNHACRLR